jgi:hypothetical protein
MLVGGRCFSKLFLKLCRVFPHPALKNPFNYSVNREVLKAFERSYGKATPLPLNRSVFQFNRPV